MRKRIAEPGFIISALIHVGALGATLLAFSQTPKFDDIQETVPIEMVTNSQFNEIMKGEKDAKEVHPEAVDKADKVDPVVESKPTPPAPDQTKDVPTPPPPPPPPPTPPVKQAETPPPPTPPERPADPPPPQPVPLPPPMPQPTPPPPVMPPPRPVDTPPVPDTVPLPPTQEADATPMPPPKPHVVKPVPVPPAPPPPVPLPPDVPKPHEAHNPPTPHPSKPKPDKLASLLADLPNDPAPPSPKTSPSHAKPHPDTSADSKFDPNDISKILNSHEAPSQRASTAHDQSRVASLGSPTAHAAKMSPSLWGALDGLLEEQYRQCWSYLGLTSEQKYIPQVRVVFSPNGTLEAEPVLVNPPSDPSLQSLADSAVRAVRRCNPLHIPDEYAPYYDQWKGRVLRFDPEDMAG